jgi:hypothetical protein
MHGVAPFYHRLLKRSSHTQQAGIVLDANAVVGARQRHCPMSVYANRPCYYSGNIRT